MLKSSYNGKLPNGYIKTEICVLNTRGGIKTMHKTLDKLFRVYKYSRLTKVLI